jgi:hypothetical protein
MVILNHQPVGNFERVFTEATDRAYDPMLEALAGEVQLGPDRPARLWHFPLEAVSDSES